MIEGILTGYIPEAEMVYREMTHDSVANKYA